MTVKQTVSFWLSVIAAAIMLGLVLAIAIVDHITGAL